MMTKKQINKLVRIIISTLIVVAAFLLQLDGLISLGVHLMAYFVVGYDIILKSIKSIFKGNVFNENLLLLIATIGAFVLKQYSEALMVIILFQVGELFESYAVGKSRKSIAQLMDIRPDYANVERNGKIEKVSPDEVLVDEIIVVKAGEKVPIDGIVEEGYSVLDVGALTGESLPREVAVGDDVVSGSINKSGTIRIIVKKTFENSTVSKILELVENASSKKANSENFISKFARYYTPCIVLATLIFAIVPPLLFAQEWATWINRSLIFLVISCPCALVISVPLSFFSGIGFASKNGILIKGGNYIEALSKMQTIVFDKTGTLTKGEFKVTAVLPNDCEENELVEMATLAEMYSNHPISRSLREYCKANLDTSRIENSQEISGKGIQAIVDGKTLLVGNDKLMLSGNVEFTKCDEIGTVLYVAIDGKYKGCIVISDEIKPQSISAIAGLKKAGIKKIAMLTGDIAVVGEKIAKNLKIEDVYTQLLPDDKVTIVEKLISEKTAKSTLAFVGDGINDAPVLSRSDIGIAMGAIGSDAAIEAADVVLMDDNPEKILTALSISKHTVKIVRFNIIFSLSVKLLVMILGVSGHANMFMAIFADVGVSIIAIIIAMSILRYKVKE